VIQSQASQFALEWEGRAWHSLVARLPVTMLLGFHLLRLVQQIRFGMMTGL
jgi:hypothetical protein